VSPWLPELYAMGVVAAVATVPFWLTDLDLTVAETFFHPGADGGGWPEGERPLWQLFYHGLPIVTAVLSIAALSVLALAAFRAPLARWRPHAALLLATLVLGPGLLVNGVFKENWGRPRPRQTLELGGEQAYVPPLRPNFAGEGKSFACGHCSVGFSLVAGWFLLRPVAPWVARGVLALALGIGLLSGVGRMAAGGHFLSDVLWSGLLTYFAAWVSYFFLLRVPERRQRLSQSPPLTSRHPWLEGGAYGLLAVTLLGGSLVLIPAELEVRLRQPLDALPAGTRALRVDVGQADLDLIFLSEGSAEVRADGRLQGAGLPTNRLEARIEPPSASQPVLGVRVVTDGYFSELAGRISVTLPAGAFDTLVVTVARGDLRLRRSDPDATLPELTLTVPRGTIEGP
jgi:membrane-associated PAP2 superfamily phosphatase